MRDKSLKSGERQYGPTLNHVEEWHRWRYAETIPHVAGKVVLDVGCGVGYGSYMMAPAAKYVLGIDDSPEAIAFANEHYRQSNNGFRCVDILQFVEEYYADVVVAFEVIEHIKDTDGLFARFASLCPGKFIVSTPHQKCPISGNKFHHRHYGMDELIERFWDIGYRPERAELRYFGKGLCNFLIVKKG